MAGNLNGPGRLPQASTMVAILLVLAVSAARAEQNPAPTIEEIQKAWQARQDRVHTAKFTWKEKRTWPKGSISSTFGPALVRGAPELEGQVMPPVDTTVDFSSTLSMDGGKIKFEYDGKEWATGKQGFRQVKYHSVFDGNTGKDLYPHGVGDGDWPLGAIRRDPNYTDAGLAALRPLLILYRPFSPKLKPINIRGMGLLASQAMIDGRPCVELVRQLPKNSSVYLWLDISRGCILTRRLVVDQEVPREQIDIRYRPDTGGGWIPTSWKHINHNPKGELLCSIDAVIEKAEFNTELEPNSFNLEFPPGTRVLDEKADSHGFIIRKDGNKRPVLDADIGATYEQMMNSEPGEALGRDPHLKPHWWVALAAMTALAALGVFIWRRFRLRKSLPRNS